MSGHKNPDWWRTPKGRQTARVCRDNQRARLRELYDSLKRGKPCTDCRCVLDPVCMDWDHVRGEKLFNIKQAVASRMGRERLLEEIAKCELVCSNCHRLRTKQRGYYGIRPTQQSA